MLRSTQFLLESCRTPFLALGFCVFFGFSTLAQEEKDRVTVDPPKASEMTLEEGSSSPTDLVVKKTTSTAKGNAGVTKKESASSKQGGEKDGKKEEVSTLSFNLFLYIVDKFKED